MLAAEVLLDDRITRPRRPRTQIGAYRVRVVAAYRWG